MMLDLPDDAVHRIAGESEWRIAERKTLREKLDILVSGQRDLKRLSEHHHSVFGKLSLKANRLNKS